MKNLFFLFITVFTVLFNHVGYSQVIYSDNFDQNTLTIEATESFTPSLSNNNLTLSSNGGGPTFEAIAYGLHDGGDINNVNIQSSPKLFIRAKASNNPEFRIDLQDANEFTTTASAQSINLTDSFQIYELDYSGKLEDGGFGGPCEAANAPCPVDASIIRQLIFFANPADGNYNGTIEIDWISLGASLEEISNPSQFEIRYNQVSYLIGRDKKVNIVSPQGSFSDKAYTVFDSDDKIVTSGTTGSSQFWDDTKEHVTTVDISSVNTEGTYRFAIDESEINFKVSADGYAELREEAFKYYYYNRASTELTATYAGQYARPAGHPDDVVLVHSSAASAERPTGTIISAPKGWYDAGDYNKYIVNSGISTYTLLAAYEHYQLYYQNTNFSIPEEGGNIPDILDETIWNIDWMLDMQDPNDGGVYHKLTDLNFSANVMPNGYTADRYVVQKTTSAALNFAAVTAVASRLFADFESEKPGYSARLIEASKKAYDWAKANPTIFYRQPSDVKTGEYQDENVNDEFQWAAVELFITTNEDTYKNDINVNSIFGGLPSWPTTAPLALISIAHHTASLSSSIDTNTANNKLISTADEIKNTINTSPMNIGMTTDHYVWGSNSNAGNQLIILIRAFELTNDDSYLSAAFTGMDYIFGRNGSGFSYVTGFGNKTPQDPHHRISFADNIQAPLPGMMVGGPHSGQQDVKDGCTGYPNDYPSSSYLDAYCSYSTNEITINWNAPLVYAMNALHFYQDESGVLSTDDISNTVKERIDIYPNPTSNVLNIKLANTTSQGIIELYTIQGKKILSQNINDNISQLKIAAVANGIYLAKIVANNQTYTKKVVKQ